MSSKVKGVAKVKGIAKDITISGIIAISTFFIMFLFKKSVLISDLYSQGLDFLEFYKNHLSFKDNSWLYSWNIALGDSTYAQALYYLLSPFNVILLFFKKYSMLAILPYFMTLKMTVLAYITSLYFREISKNGYKWLGTIIYMSCYYIIIYGSYQVMWLDTFIFLPLVLLGIERVIKDKGKKLFVISVFLFISSNYYMAIIMIPHIALYGVIRYIYLKGKTGIFKYILNMALLAIISIALSSFVLIPAIDIMSSSAKSSNSVVTFLNSYKRVAYIFTQNFIGFTASQSDTYITIFGMITSVAYLIFGNIKKSRLYLIPIGVIVFAIFNDKLNYIFNFAYSPAGGNYRYNVILNIYIGIIACMAIKELVEENNRKLKLGIITVGCANLIILISQLNNLGQNLILINIICLVAYLAILLLLNKNRKWLVVLLSILVLAELTGQIFITYTKKNMIPNETRYEYTRLLNYMKDNYGDQNRIEIRDTISEANIYLAHNIEGVSGYSSLINTMYSGIGKVLGNTSEYLVRQEFKGRNIIANLVDTEYYISKFNYSPYTNSKLIDTFVDNNTYYIFQIENSYIKYFDKESLIEGGLDKHVTQRDALLYSNLIIPTEGEKVDIEKLEGDIIKSIPIESNIISITQSGEYYLITPKDDKNIQSVDFSINGNYVEKNLQLPYLQADYMEKNEIYLGNFSNGDILELPEALKNYGELEYIDGEYIKGSIKEMNRIETNSLIRKNGWLKAEVETSTEGYIFFPIAYDKNWNIIMDGKKVNPIIANGGFMSLEANSGNHVIEMTYKSKAINLGISVSLITLVLIFVSKSKKIGYYIYNLLKRR
ncbi:YfhO family protein [Clostridium gasigenes]|uniref:YfhO family protein n=1 Tax=Clostridium gasigenes TaxID=94869 RepID=UPI001C0D20DD|nr:YfhO family protein [Clostridium gasigenes]MBU3137143.1 YfhO family protein [Clostridium gasigenes]